MPTDEAELAGRRIDELLAEARTDPRGAALAEELTACLVKLYGTGLARIIEMAGPEIARGLCSDPLVESLLLVHDLHPMPVDRRIRRALRQAWPEPEGVTFLGLDPDGVAHLRLESGVPGCSSSRQAALRGIEAAVRQAAPEASEVEIEIPAPPAPLLQISLRPDHRG